MKIVKISENVGPDLEMNSGWQFLLEKVQTPLLNSFHRRLSATHLPFSLTFVSVYKMQCSNR